MNWLYFAVYTRRIEQNRNVFIELGKFVFSSYCLKYLLIRLDLMKSEHVLYLDLIK